eukprot:Hpha_TRINITY_DN18735_c0_g1::TRINITY_DN18735_c0_g1_i1::g.47372::m.47372
MPRFLALLALTTVAVSTDVSVSVDGKTGVYTLSVDSLPWYESAVPVVCVGGDSVTLSPTGSKPASGTDKFGTWTGTATSYESSSPKALMELVFKQYANMPQLVVGTASFPHGLNTSNCGSNEDLSTQFPAFNTSAAQATSVYTLSWRSGVIAVTAAAKGLEKLGANGLDCGPVASTLIAGSSRTTLVWSSLDSHKILPQKTTGGVYQMGVAGAIPSLPSGFNYSIVFTASTGGATQGVYEWGKAIQGFYDMSYSKRLPSVTLSDVGYYTDDGAYYYVWGGGKELKDPQLSTWIPPRPWAAEKGLVLVKEALYAMGVPVAYMQLDDWWYQGPFYFGNVKAVVDWHASNSSGLFPNGLPAFSDALGLPLQLYTPFWDDKYETKYRTFESTSFKGTKLVVPDDSYAFFSDLFDLGLKMTNGRFNTYEIDFLDANFKGCAACFNDVTAADRWYRGMADAALERNISIQYCLPSATDMLQSLEHKAVVQARASGDFARPEGSTAPWGNVVTLGGSSLLMGATAMAPSKDTLWTASPQPPTSSDRTHSGYKTAPHVQLDSILATLSLGPVGISDGLNETDPGLIGQAFRNSKDSTLLRPSLPLTTLDSMWINASDAGLDADVGKGITSGVLQDVRGTHASIGTGPTSWYLLAWMTTLPVTLQSTDLFPSPAAGVKLGVRKHVVEGDQFGGCEDGKPAVPGCIQTLGEGEMPTLPAVASTKLDITAYGYWSVYEPAANGAYLLGELNKFVHVSPQRFRGVSVKGSGPCGLTIEVMGSNSETVKIVCVDPTGTVHITAVQIPQQGTAQVAL